MMRAALVAATAMAFGGATAAGAGGAMHDAGAALGRIVARGTAGVIILDAPDHAAVVRAPAGTPLLAVAAGSLAVPEPGHAALTGSDADAGLDVDYTGLGDTAAGGAAERGAVVGHVLVATQDVTVRAVLDGTPLDTAAVLRAALDGVSSAGWHRPVDGATVSQPFGCTPYAMEPVDHACPSGHIHTGIDLAAPLGTPIRAALDGVAHVVVSTTGYGLHVVVDSGNGLTTLYGHMSAVEVHDGDEVSAGDVIGAVGSTGNSTGPHLHFEVRRDGIPEDPTLDLALP